MTSTTATTRGAMEHARAKAAREAAAVRAKPTIPASDATALPAGVPHDRLFWDETLAAGGYASRVLERGSRLRIEDLEGDACVSLLVCSADRPQERLNVADTVKVQWQAYLGRGALLLSDMGRVLLSIVEDTSPPIVARARAVQRLAVPDPVKRTSGRRPRTVVPVVMRIGRTRSVAPRTAASSSAKGGPSAPRRRAPSPARMRWAARPACASTRPRSTARSRSRVRASTT